MNNTKMTPLPTDLEFATLATKFHREVISHFSAVIHAARNAGQALNAAKKLVYSKAGDKKGAWTNWLKANFKEASPQTARVYMRVDRGWKILEPEVAQHGDLSLARALQILKVKPDGTEKKDPPQDLIARCQRAICRAFDDCVRKQISPATAVFLAGSSGKFLIESRCRFFTEFLERLKTEVDPIAQVLFAADRDRSAAIEKLGDTMSPRQEEETETAYVRAVIDAFKGKEGILTEYQKETIREEIIHSAVVQDQPWLLKPFRTDPILRERSPSLSKNATRNAQEVAL
jgi:hypothetical protein